MCQDHPNSNSSASLIPFQHLLLQLELLERLNWRTAVSHATISTFWQHVRALGIIDARFRPTTLKSDRLEKRFRNAARSTPATDTSTEEDSLEPGEMEIEEDMCQVCRHPRTGALSPPRMRVGVDYACHAHAQLCALCRHPMPSSFRTATASIGTATMYHSAARHHQRPLSPSPPR